MADIVEMQLNALYYEAGLVAVRSFLEHNPHFTVVVREFGLEPCQIRELAKSTTVISGDVFLQGGRFQHVTARLEAFLSLVPDGGISLFLDADTVTNQSIESWKQLLLKSKRCISLVREEADFPLCGQINPRACEIFPKLPSYQHRPGYNWGVILIHRTEESVGVLKEFARSYFGLLRTRPEKASYFTFLEQTFGNCFLLENDISVLEVDGRYNGLVRTGKCSALEGKYFYNGEPSFIVHFIGSLFREGEHATPDMNDVFGLYRLLKIRYAEAILQPNGGNESPKR